MDIVLIQEIPACPPKFECNNAYLNMICLFMKQRRKRVLLRYNYYETINNETIQLLLIHHNNCQMSPEMSHATVGPV